MLAFLKTDPAKKFKREIDASSAKGTKLAARLEAASSQVLELSQAPARLARSGADDAALMLARAKVEDAKALVAMLSDAVADEDKLRAGLEQQLADLADRAQRQETADELDAKSIALENVAKKFEEVAGEFAELTDLMAPYVLDAAAVSNFLRGARAEIAPAVPLLSSLLNARARGVRAGIEPATLPTPAPATVPLPPAPEMEAIWLIQPVAFSQNGQIVVRDLNQHLRLPPILVTKAVDVGAGVRIGDPRAGKRVTSWRQWYAGGPLPGLDKCQHLDVEAETAAAKEKQKSLPHEIIRHSSHSLFQPLDRGPTYQMRTSGPSHTPDEEGGHQ
jgi:hypothetical protein